MEKICKTCINNDDGLCDRKGILVEDEENIYRNSNYCHKCGQALDWEEVNNNEL